MQIAYARRRRPTLPMTSLVDVCFILLFFFMLASQPTQGRRLPVRVAAPTAAATATPETRVWRVALAAGGVLRREGQQLTLDALAASACAQPALRLILVPEPSASLQDAVRVFDRLRPCGVATAFGLGAP